MGYQALLFCPDERTARTVTQVLNELEFNVESCIEPFAAVKKLMGQHFDAVVVDCDNEQNATLLFKSARNSTPNQASLAVAVVEGQAGVAKAFRIGANLVLTKPINIEQAKGTLRVARGLLRKGDPAKPAAAPAAPAAPATPAKPVASKPVPPVKPAAPTTLAAATAQRQFAAAAAPPVKPPTPVPPPVPARAATHDDDLLELGDSKPAPVAPAVAQAAAPVAPPTVPSPVAETKSPFIPAPSIHASGAASAPAPAREVQAPPPAEVLPAPAASPAADLFEKPSESAAAAAESSSYSGSTPSFTFGGAATEEKSSGLNKKILFAVAGVALAAGALYVGWTTLHGSGSQPAHTPGQTASAAPTAQPAAQPAETSSSAPTSTPTASLPAQPVSKPAASAPASDVSDDNSDAVEAKSAPATESKKPANSVAPAKTAAAPLVLKGGKAPTLITQSTAPDAPPPSMISVPATGASAPPLNLGSTGDIPKPVLQSVNVSQGVSQGLVVKRVTPVYPRAAIQLRIEGNVELLATISKTGDITHIKVLSGDQQLTKAAVDAVKQWRYKPYLLSGEPVEIQTQITVKFKLPN